MKLILRATRGLTAAIVSLHVAALRKTVGNANVKVERAAIGVKMAKNDLDLAHAGVRAARVNVREFQDLEKLAVNDARNTRIAAEGEAKFWGRDL